jgi:predicted permease
VISAVYYTGTAQEEAARILPAGMELNAIVFGVFIIELSMPVGSCIALIAKDKGADMDCCMKGVVLSTVASVITIPIIGIFL